MPLEALHVGGRGVRGSRPLPIYNFGFKRKSQENLLVVNFRRLARSFSTYRHKLVHLLLLCKDIRFIYLDGVEEYLPWTAVGVLE